MINLSSAVVVLTGVMATPRLGLWLDNSDQTPDEAIDEILAKLSLARLPD
ncbi:hypothetical protein AAH979_19135 [Plantactinospora sp. ZYX-F-223]